MNTSKPWRNSPFTAGKKYRVTRDFKAQRDSFRSSECLIYSHDVYSIYDSCTGYLFKLEGSEDLRIWDVYDDEELEGWRTFLTEEP